MPKAPAENLHNAQHHPGEALAEARHAPRSEEHPDEVRAVAGPRGMHPGPKGRGTQRWGPAGGPKAVEPCHPPKLAPWSQRREHGGEVPSERRRRPPPAIQTVETQRHPWETPTVESYHPAKEKKCLSLWAG